MQVAAAEEMEAAPRGQEMERARGSLEFLGRWNDKRDDRAMPIKLKAERYAENMVRVALGRLVDELVQTNAPSGVLAISTWVEEDDDNCSQKYWGVSWSASADDVSYQRHGFVGMQSGQRQNIRFADFEGVVDDFGALSQIAVYRVTLPSGGLGLNWTPKRYGTVSPALAERIKVALLCAVRDRKRPHEERSLALLPNRILIHNIFSYLADVNSVKWVGRPPPPAPEELYTGPRRDGLLSTDEISGDYSAAISPPGCSDWRFCNSMTVAPRGPDTIETWRSGCIFHPPLACGPVAEGAVVRRNPRTNNFGGTTFSADGTASGCYKKRQPSQKRAFQKVETRDLAGDWCGCVCPLFMLLWPLSFMLCTTKTALNEDQYEESGSFGCLFTLCLPLCSVESETRTRRYVNGHPTNGFAKDGGDPRDVVHWHRDPGCAGGCASDCASFFAKKVG